MTYKTNTLLPTSATIDAAMDGATVVNTTLEDFKNAVLIVSIAANVFALSAWLAIRIAGL
jgi:hypothetical protein